MDINKMLADLRLEREQIEEAIMTLERLARGRGRRRGRPPAWMSMIKRRGRPPGSKNRAQSQLKGATRKSAGALAFLFIEQVLLSPADERGERILHFLDRRSRIQVSFPRRDHVVIPDQE